MDTGFKNFLLDDAKKWEDGPIKEATLMMLKHNPDQLKANIAFNLQEWAMAYCVESGEIVFSMSTDDDAGEIMEGWKEMFAEDLEKIK